MASSSWRYFVALTLLTVLPASLSADDLSGGAILRSNGGVLVNKSAAPPSIAVFSRDVIENRSDAVAWIQYDGSSVEISPETIITLGNGEILLDHGIVTVTTVRQFRVHTGCVVATPVTADETVYTMKDTDRRMTVYAQKKDVILDSHSTNLKRASQPQSLGREVVHQKQQQTRDEHCGAGDLPHSAGDKPILDSPSAIGATAPVIVGGTLCILLCFSDKPPSPCSPSGSSTTCSHP